MINYPASLDALTNPTSTDLMNDAAVYHDEQHANVNDIVEALMRRVGITGSSGTVALGNGDSGGTVTGLALPTTPNAVLLTVQAPADSQAIFAWLVGAPTTDGFVFKLSADTDATTYKVHYKICYA